MPKKRQSVTVDEMEKIKAEAEAAAVKDITKEVEQITRQAPKSLGETDSFLEHKLQVLESDTTTPAEAKAKTCSELRAVLQKRSGTRPPPPGGVGYGVFYTSDFRRSFGTGTALQMFIHCPNTAGGNVDDFLYLTSTNRASKGVEAFVLYFKQDEFKFLVFDWARPDDQHWQVDLPHSSLHDYIFDIEGGGRTCQTLFLINMTYQTDTSEWTNAVLLLNRAIPRFDLIYSFSYTSSPDEQKTGGVGTWGPIVETFQTDYTNTNALGFLEVSLTSRVSGVGAWSPSGWERLSSSQSSIRNDSQGFDVVCLEPNFTFVVQGHPS